MAPLVQYGLPPHIFVAFDGAYSVWLDVRRDRYSAIERARTVGFHEIVPGWPDDESNFRDEVPVSEVHYRGIRSAASAQREAQLVRMREAGLLVPLNGKHDARMATPAPNAQLAVEICLPVLATVPRVHAHHLCHITRAWIVAVATLKYRGLSGAIRRMKRLSTENQIPNPDEGKLRGLISAFAQVRPFLFAARGRCLLNALVLSEFLGRYGIGSNCVFGVHSRPFAAHCWLECGNRVLNDSVERVRGFTPILRV